MKDEELSGVFRQQVGLYETALVENSKMSFISARGGDLEELTLFKIIREEIHGFFCSEDQYEEARERALDDFDKILMFVCGGVATAAATAGLSIPIAVVTAATALVLRVTMSVGVEALCRYVTTYSLK